MSIPSTKPATEQDLFVENDTHGFEEKKEIETPKMHSVLVDGWPAKAGVGSFGAFSTRIVIKFDSPHPEYGEEFATKHFMFDESQPGLVRWGHDNATMRIQKILEQ
ncbi:MAG: hypothetical protein CL988_02300 [Euryarchaeota archaeon]|nr:hypothetical protein [Euryarchaeota archaeon]